MQEEPTNTNEVEEVVADEPQEIAEPTVDESPVEEVEEASNEENTSEEQPQEEAPQEEVAKEDPVQPSRRETLRVQNLLKKYGPPQEKQAPSQNKKDALDYNTLDASPDVIEQLEQDRQAYSDRAYTQGIQQSELREWKRDLKYEAPAVEKAYSFLNPNDKANFNHAAADAMNQKYLRFIGYNPGDPSRGIQESVQHSDVSYKEFVDSEMEFVDELANRKIAASKKNIAKQAASTGIRPDGNSPKRMNLNKDPSEMTLEELYAASGLTRHK